MIRTQKLDAIQRGVSLNIVGGTSLLGAPTPRRYPLTSSLCADCNAPAAAAGAPLGRWSGLFSEVGQWPTDLPPVLHVTAHGGLGGAIALRRVGAPVDDEDDVKAAADGAQQSRWSGPLAARGKRFC